MNTSPDGTLTAAERLITHLQASAEVDKAVLARALHDDLGGLMMAAVMDLASVQQLASQASEPVRVRLDRVKLTLESAIDLKRRIIEELRPSILDNFGLLAALKWQFKRQCQVSAAACEEQYPTTEPQLSPEQSIGVFRVAQEALALSFNREAVTAVSLRVDVANGALTLSIADNGVHATSPEGLCAAATILASMRHRMRVLDGTVEWRQPTSTGSELLIHIPLNTAIES